MTAAYRQVVIEGDGVLIPLTRGKLAVVDAMDAALGEFTWYAKRHQSGLWYAERNSPRPLRRIIKLHRAVAERAGMSIVDMEMDHKDGDGLNCRRSNLRPATRAQNQHNRGLEARNTSGIKGVSWECRRQKWQAKIRLNGRQFWLGYFDTKEEAATVYAAASSRLHGEFACNDRRAARAEK